MWALGDYHRFATQLVWEVGPVVVEAAGIRPGMRVLDVAAGTGNVAVRAAEAGADVVASDLTPENLAAGRAAAEARGIELDWVEADAEALPFADGAFDAVTSAFGVMFAPDHRAAARELLRVCRPGGTIALASFAPDGAGGRLLRHARTPRAAAGGRAAAALGHRGAPARAARRRGRRAALRAPALRRARPGRAGRTTPPSSPRRSGR